MDSPFDSRMDSPFDARMDSPFDARMDSPLDARMDSPLDSRMDSPLDSRVGRHAGADAVARAVPEQHRGDQAAGLLLLDAALPPACVP
eukprot:733141-Prorocentrum_minimum.AAC.1